MSTRTTATGLAGLFAGILLLFFLDSTLSTVIGLVLLVAGGGIATLAGLLGIGVSDPRRAQDAAARHDADTSAALQRASETGRWPRVIGGG